MKPQGGWASEGEERGGEEGWGRKIEDWGRKIGGGRPGDPGTHLTALREQFGSVYLKLRMDEAEMFLTNL